MENIFFMVTAEETKVFANAEDTAIIHEVGNPHFFRLRVRGTLTTETYKEAFNKLREHMEPAMCPRMLYDASGLNASDPEARAWLIKSFFPEVTKVFDEPLVAALILPQSMFMKMVVNIVTKAMTVFGKSFVIQSFDTEAKASEWLAEQQSKSKYP